MKEAMVEPSLMADIAPANIETPISSREDGLQSTLQTPAVSIADPKRKGRPPKTVPANPPPKHRLPESVTSLPPKLRTFVQAYTDPESATYSNGTQSALSAKIGNTYMSAAVGASELLKTGKIRNAINELLEDHGLGSKDRISIISELANQRTQLISHYDADGNLTQRQEVDNGKLRLQAVVQAGKLAGDYARAENVAKAQRDALQPMVLHYAKLLRESLKAPTAEHATEGQGSIEGTDGQDKGQEEENPGDA
jgi:hypothetical protein